MTEVVSAIELGNAVISGGRSAKSIVGYVRRFLTPDLKWLIVQPGKQAISAVQLEDIGRFLRSPAAVPLLQLAWIDRYLEGPTQERGVFKNTFLAAAKAWCLDHSGGWESLAGDIWERIESRISTTVPTRSSVQVRAEIDSASYLSGALDNKEDRTAFGNALMDLGQIWNRFLEVIA